MIRYKLTNQNLMTYNYCQWNIGEKKTTSGEGNLCGPGWLHCYTHPILAVLLNPLHANFLEPRLFEVEADGKCEQDLGLKEGWTEMTLLKEIDLPQISIKQAIIFILLLAKEVYSSQLHLVSWINKCLNDDFDFVDVACEENYFVYYGIFSVYAAIKYNSFYHVDDAIIAIVTANNGIDLIPLIEKSLTYK